MLFAKIRNNPYTPYVINALTWIPVAIFFVDHGYSYAAIDGRSMQPTFNPDSNKLSRDIVLLEKWSLRKDGFERGQVVTLRSPIEPNKILTKRIIALPGDTVKPLRRNEEIAVPAGHVWVEGDEAFHSKDSNSFGTVPIGLITAKVTRIIYPFNRFGIVEKKTVGKERVKIHVFNPRVMDP
ncbi:mitochondrial inner membrane peptidase complex catalytic subunit 2 [Mycotypha africana]|uniref:mitochondrial inner membrane peptidase complex catalytic subunit 2 n=1 Tax=Mycotypha africana TaxID=64632 RepID=UPI002301C9E3|nr:mitochondrial inner membrane peptidase complex catalytic subunit 2 [Mycotypha africana]KAI8990842.1 mitochondrial inner membrane peptidase complex catalytic subunit 2 [Mycotypha africana]